MLGGDRRVCMPAPTRCFVRGCCRALARRVRQLGSPARRNWPRLELRPRPGLRLLPSPSPPPFDWRATPERGQMLRRACCKPLASVFQHGTRRQTACMEVGSTAGAAVRIAPPSLDQLIELLAYCSLPPAADRRRCMSAPRAVSRPLAAHPSNGCELARCATQDVCAALRELCLPRFGTALPTLHRISDPMRDAAGATDDGPTRRFSQRAVYAALPSFPHAIPVAVRDGVCTRLRSTVVDSSIWFLYYNRCAECQMETCMDGQDGKDVWLSVVGWRCGGGCDGSLVGRATTRDRSYVCLLTERDSVVVWLVGSSLLPLWIPAFAGMTWVLHRPRRGQVVCVDCD